MSDTAFLDLAVAARALRAKQVTSVELTTATLARIAALGPPLRAFIAVTEERALFEAKRADNAIAAGSDLGPMHGLPYAVKDFIDVQGLPTTCNSYAATWDPAVQDATAVTRLATGGAVIVGKLNCAEYGAGGSGVGLPFGKPVNPWDATREPGASSTGAGVALAAGMLSACVATDTGGSIRQPAAYCGIVGLKPTRGRVSRTGTAALSPTLDHCGPMGRSVADVARLLQAIAGYDRFDPASVDRPVPAYASSLSKPLAGVRVGLLRDHWGFAGISDPALLAAIDRLAGALDNDGAVVLERVAPSFEAFRVAGMPIMLSEAFETHRERMRSRLDDYSPETAARFLVGAAISAVDVARARNVAQHLATRMNALFDEVDLLLMPTAVAAAPPLAEVSDVRANPNRMPALPFNLTGHPAISVPVTLDSDGMPLALQIVARHWEELLLLRAAGYVEALSRATIASPR